MDIWSTDSGLTIDNDVDNDRRPLLQPQDEGQVLISPGPHWPAKDEDEKEEEEVEVKVYPQRWYILVLFAMLCFLQGGFWNTWGPISVPAEKVYGWSDADIALLSNWGPIAYVVSAAQFAWLMDVKGLRWASLLTAVLVAVGAGLRCITSSNPAATWLIHTGHFLIGLGGPVAMGAAPLVSAVWFPAHHRTSTTAFIAGLNGIGVAVSFIIGPLIVPVRDNSTSPHNISTLSPTTDTPENDYEQMKNDIMKLMYIEFGAAALVFILMLVYFPSKPKLPPSRTASVQRTDFKEGLKKLFCHKSFWLLATPYAISGGVFGAWGSVLNVNLDKRGISQGESGWLGFYFSVAGCLVGLVVGRFADIFKKRMKLFMLILYCTATASFFVFCLAYVGLIPLSKALLYTTLIIGGICLTGSDPLYFELCCEMTYPIAEGLTNSLLTWLNNVSSLIFLLIPLIPNIGTEWMNWCLLGSVGICVPILCLVRERYARLNVDIDDLSVSTSQSLNAGSE